MIAWLHPLIQFLGILLSFYVLALGAVRFSVSHLGKKGRFPWKRHVALGKAVIGLWLVGMILGSWVVRALWESESGLTGWHHTLAMVMLPIMAVGFASGWLMNR
ncbi:MAG: DUF4079 domain-containing protein, partial [Deltaproteobacteria bacterium]|nr:DUF4079 domain-containing protein [Deltaproteobacteria bacterium]